MVATEWAWRSHVRRPGSAWEGGANPNMEIMASPGGNGGQGYPGHARPRVMPGVAATPGTPDPE